MAHEIRVLEDQLYEADYHNRVLIDKLEQVRLKGAPAKRSKGSNGSSIGNVPSPVRNRDSGSEAPVPMRDPLPDSGNSLTPPELPQFDAGDISIGEQPESAAPDSNDPNSIKSDSRGSDPGTDRSPATEPNVDDIDDLDSMFDEGNIVDPDEVEAPASDPFADDPSSPNAQQEGDEPMQKEEGKGFLLPAPGGPEPPGKSDTEIPPVLPGEILPPSTIDAEEDKPPGQILIPDSAKDGSGVPDQLRLHPSLSGGNRVEGEISSMMIVVNVLDRQGRPLDLSDFDVDAELSVVLYDAEQQSQDAEEQSQDADQESEDAAPSDLDETDPSRIGRWDFAADQVLDFVKSDPISGLHIPILWNGRQPSGDEIIVHVRLRSEEDEMRCEGRIKVERANAVATWTPRGDSLE